MPVIGVTISESPGYPVNSQATGYLGIFINIPVVIVVKKIVAKRLAEYRPGYRRQKNTYAQDFPVRSQPSVS